MQDAFISHLQLVDARSSLDAWSVRRKSLSSFCLHRRNTTTHARATADPNPPFLVRLAGNGADYSSPS
jgi:hypothetical protein